MNNEELTECLGNMWDLTPPTDQDQQLPIKNALANPIDTAPQQWRVGQDNC